MYALMLAGAALLALWGAVTLARRRAVRRTAEAEARSRARRRTTVPVVSSNLQGQAARGPSRERDLWVETAADPRPPES